MSANAPLPPAPDVWRAQYLRLIAFPINPVFDQSRGWWRELTGDDHENVTEKQQRHERETSGPFGGAELTLNVDLLRAQWTAGARIDPANLEGVPNMGAFLTRRDWFGELMRRWLEQCQAPIRRLAFAGSLVQTVPGEHRETYMMLDRYLRCVDLDPESTDILYRVNRPSDSGVVAGLKINHLTTWAAVKMEVHMVMRNAPAVRQTAPPTAYSCLFEFDINTDAERLTELPRTETSRLFAEFSDYALQIATHGDTRP